MYRFLVMVAEFDRRELYETWECTTTAQGQAARRRPACRRAGGRRGRGWFRGTASRGRRLRPRGPGAGQRRGPCRPGEGGDGVGRGCRAAGGGARPRRRGRVVGLIDTGRAWIDGGPAIS